MSAERNRTFYLGTAAGPDNYANVNVAPPFYKVGELGSIVPDVNTGRRWQFVQLDSGATAATATGIVAAGQVAFWKDKSRYLVTNDALQANAANAPAGGWGNAGNATLDARNFIAGFFTIAVTATAPSGQDAGNGTLILQRTDQKTGYSIVAPAPGVAYNAGNSMVVNTGTNADCVAIAAGGAITSVLVGTCLGGRVAGKVPVWINLPETD